MREIKIGGIYTTKLKEITFRYLTDTIPYGALYITDKGRICDLSMLERDGIDARRAYFARYRRAGRAELREVEREK